MGLKLLALALLATMVAARSVPDVDEDPASEDLSPSERQKRQMWMAPYPAMYFPHPLPMPLPAQPYSAPTFYNYREPVDDQITYVDKPEGRVFLFQTLTQLISFIQNLITPTTTTTTTTEAPEDTTETVTDVY